MKNNILKYFLLALLLLSGAAQASKPVIVFLSQQQARAAIIDDKGEPYFSTLQPMEMAAKTGHELTTSGLLAQQRETRERYRFATLEFGPQEKKAITAIVKGIDTRLRGHYNLVANLPWKFLKVDDNIEGGLPHTRGAYIVLSKTVARQLVQLDQQYPPQAAAAIGASILLHEHIHVLQRSNPRLFDSLYKNVWGFMHVDAIKRSGWLLKHHLANPDGLDCGWLFPVDGKNGSRYILPDVIFADGGGLKRMPQDFRMVALEVRKSGNRYTLVTGANGRPSSRPLMQVADYVRVFAISENIYHPNEASADLLTQLVQYEFMLDKSKIPPANRQALEQALAPLKRWADSHL
jgi:hypothetical protein